MLSGGGGHRRATVAGGAQPAPYLPLGTVVGHPFATKTLTGLATGVWEFIVTAKDTAGNESPEQSVPVVVTVLGETIIKHVAKKLFVA